MNVAVLGASANPDRYSNRAVALLKAKGHTVFPVHPAVAEIHGLAVYPSLTAVPEAVDTITVYLAADKSSALAADFRQIGPKRVIFNPGAENPALAAVLEQDGCRTLEACTLVLLQTGQF
jgi:predicted CoA-binding protein